MRASAYLLRKYAPAAVGMPRSTKPPKETRSSRVSQHPPWLMERATGRLRARVADVHRLWAISSDSRRQRGRLCWICRPHASHARWSGQRDVCLFASQIRTGCGRLSATLPARYKRFALALRSHPVGFESRHCIEKSTAPERCRAFTFSGAGNGTRTRECQLGKLMPYHLAMPACVLASITRLSCSIQGCRCLF